MLPLEEGEERSLLFLGVPWITELSELKEHGLDLNDFPPHSAIGELLVLLQVKNSGYVETRQIARKLRRTTRELAARNELLEAEIEERERVEEQLRQSQKMEALGQLAGGVAHDFNNILLAITGHACLGAESESPEEVREHLDNIQTAARQAGDLTRRLLTFGRRKLLKDEAVRVEDALSEAREMLERIIPESISFGCECAPEVDCIRVDPTAFQQVLMNLAINARDAMPEGGELSIAARSSILVEPLVVSSGEVQPGVWVEVSVSDTGSGFEPEIAHRIFEPFFTTKAEHEGSGLGLATVWWVLERSRGHIDLSSGAEGGTVFRLYLPPAAAVEKAEATVSAPSAAGVSGARILLVEDNFAVRTLVQRVLARAGYEVTTAEEGEGALKLVQEGAGTHDLLLTDLVMPGMHGIELAQRARELLPGLRVIFMSGYDRRTVSGAEELSASTPLLTKPFQPAELLECVRKELESG